MVAALNQGFPSINMPFVDPETGVMNQTWYQFLIALWNRTGQGPGIDPMQAQVLAILGEDNGVGPDGSGGSRLLVFLAMMGRRRMI